MDSHDPSWNEQGKAQAKQAADRREEHEERGVKSPWSLVHTTPIECTMDDSGVYTVINRIVEHDVHKGHLGIRISVPCDIMSSDDTPLVSFQGSANDVRKHVIQWLYHNVCCSLDSGNHLSHEHASYIGWELHRAKTDPNYVQD